MVRSSSLFLSKLQTRVEQKRHWVLTAGIEGWGGVLKGGEGLVLPEALGQVLGGFSVEVIHCQAANESQIDASEGASGGTHVKGHALELTKRRCIWE